LRVSHVFNASRKGISVGKRHDSFTGTAGRDAAERRGFEAGTSIVGLKVGLIATGASKDLVIPVGELTVKKVSLQVQFQPTPDSVEDSSQ
jgi:hypothetical protein